MADNKAKQPQIEGIATLLVLNDELRKVANIREFGFFVTNETHRLLPYHTAYLWEPKAMGGVQLTAQSGTAEIDEHAPQNQWLIGVIGKLMNEKDAKISHQIDQKHTSTEGAGLDLNMEKLSAEDEFAQHLLWCPFVSKSNELIGGLVLFREHRFTDDEIKMINWLIASYQYTWGTLIKQKKTAFIKKMKERPYLIALYVLIAVVLLFPTRLTIFGTGTVSPKDPTLINAPMQGVIESFAVNPGEKVKQGQLLLSLDKSDLEADVEVSKRDYLLTQAKLRSVINEGFSSQQSRSEIPLLRAQLEIDKAKLDYTSSLLAKTQISSPTAGIVIFDSKEDWIGQPIQTGERILVIANPRRVELKITVPVSNSMKVEVGDMGKFYLHGQLTPIEIKVRTLGYNAEIMPNKVLGYQLVADFDGLDDIPQLGAQGNVEIYGQRVPLIYYLLRRPIQASRRMLGI